MTTEIEPARYWRLATDRSGPTGDIWDIERLDIRFDREVSIEAHHCSGDAGAGFEAKHAFAADLCFWGGRRDQSADNAPLSLGVELNTGAFPTSAWLIHAPSPHRAEHVLLQSSQNGETWTTIAAASISTDNDVHPVLYRPADTAAAATWRLVGDTQGRFAWDVPSIQWFSSDQEIAPTLAASGDAGRGFGVENTADTTADFWGGRPDDGQIFVTASAGQPWSLDRIRIDQSGSYPAAAITLQHLKDGRWHTTRRFDALAPERSDLWVYDQPPTRPAVDNGHHKPHQPPPRVVFDRFADRRILITIAGYRDTELPATITNAIAQAAYPEHLRFAICHQFDDRTRDQLSPWHDDPRFQIDAVPHSDSRGCCWARSRTFEHYDDEPYLLQIDAHMRFAARWDIRYIEMLESIPSPLPVLTTYPPPYRFDDDGTVIYDMAVGVQRLVIERVTHDLTTVQKTHVVDDLSAPLPSPSIAAGQIFTRGRFCTDVPYDPEIYFSGEEISLAARAFTHGYDLFAPNENLIWHLYDHDEPKHWEDHASHADAQQTAVDRLRLLFQGDHKHLGKYGLGPARSLAAFERMAGIELSHSDQLTIKIDRSAIEVRDDYDAFVLVFLSNDGDEIARREIRDPAVLALATSTVTVRGVNRFEATDCVVVPTRRNGAVGELSRITL